jgi:hypothetical protein
MGAEGVALVAALFAAAIVKAMLEEGAEDFGFDPRPIVHDGGIMKGECLAVLEFDGVNMGEEAAVEIGYFGETPAAGLLRIGHLAEKAAEEVIAGGGIFDAIGQEIGDDFSRQEVKIFRDDRDEKLEDEALGARAVFAASDKLSKDIGKNIGGLAGDLDAVVFEDRLSRVRQKEAEGRGVLREIAQEEAVNRIEKLLIKVVNPELIEIAEDDVGRAMGDDVGPVFEGLIVMFFEVLLSRFHLDEDALGPEEVGEFFAAGPAGGVLALEEFELGGAGLLGDAMLEGGAGFDGAGMAQGAEEMVEECLAFALFIASERAGEGDELLEGGDQFSRGHGWKVKEMKFGGKGEVDLAAVG